MISSLIYYIGSLWLSLKQHGVHVCRPFSPNIINVINLKDFILTSSQKKL
jgi:hypothetical protein